jgi:tRNA (guanine37-N1)-methyltransferase
MHFTVLTLHPDVFPGPLGSSILGRAIAAGTIAVDVVDLRTHGLGKHRAVDDTPYGGGAGMVLRVDVVAEAIDAVRTPDSRVVLLSAGAPTFDQSKARQLSALPHLVLVCGHYEGVDARVAEVVDEELSIGDYVVTGGELPALVVLDAVARLLPGVLGNPDSSVDESFSAGRLEYPHYTRPRVWRGHAVPDVLTSGNHGAIEAWRRAAADERTRRIRPDLAARTGVDDPDGDD